MQAPTHVLFQQLGADVDSHTKQIAQAVRRSLPAATAAQLGGKECQAVEAAVREGLRAFAWRFLCHFDNVGCHLPPDILGYSISANLSGTNESGQDIRVGEQDYADTWLEFINERDA